MSVFYNSMLYCNCAVAAQLGNVPSEIRLKVARRGPVQSLHSKRLRILLSTRDDRSQWKMKSCHKKGRKWMASEMTLIPPLTEK